MARTPAKRPWPKVWLGQAAVRKAGAKPVRVRSVSLRFAALPAQPGSDRDLGAARRPASSLRSRDRLAWRLSGLPAAGQSRRSRLIPGGPAWPSPAWPAGRRPVCPTWVPPGAGGRASSAWRPSCSHSHVAVLHSTLVVSRNPIFPTPADAACQRTSVAWPWSTGVYRSTRREGGGGCGPRRAPGGPGSGLITPAR